MTHRSSKPGSTDGLAALVAGMGHATPAPLFFIDDAGHAQPLNLLAAELPEDHPAAEAVMSPVDSGEARLGHVVAYVEPGDAGKRSALVEAMVALTAQVVSRRLGTKPHREAEPPLPPGPAAIEIACERLLSVTEVPGVAEVVADAASRATGAPTVAVFVRREDGTLEIAGGRGLPESVMSRPRGADALLGWAAMRLTPTAVSSLFRMPQDAPRDDSRQGALATWLEPPFVLVPLRSGSHVVGLLCVSGIPAMPGRDAAKDACARLERLADRAGSALAGAIVVSQARREERRRRDLEIAHQIQKRLLPGRALSFPGLQLAGECRAAAQVGGDYFGFRACGEDALVATVFDVAGHGVGAAFCMTLVRSALHGELVRGGAPADVLGRANALASEDLAESGLFATAFVVRLDRKQGRVQYASAGHSAPVHWSSRARCFVPHVEGGVPLGLFGDSRYPHGDAAFAEGDLLVLYTDGIVEAENEAGEAFGRSRLMGAVHRLRHGDANAVLRGLWRALAKFTGGRELRDDATLVVVRGAAGFGTREEMSEGITGRSAVAVRAQDGGRARARRRRVPVLSGRTK